MERFVAYDKPGFIGRDAALRERENGPRLRRVSLIIEAETADAIADEPIWARVAEDHGTITAPHSFGPARFDAQGNTLTTPHPSQDGDWRVVGWVTSGGYGHHVGLSLAQGYLPATLAERPDADLFAVEIMGERRSARIALDPPFDPAGTRMRS